jgi:outer membrane lipoprotein SlyB
LKIIGTLLAVAASAFALAGCGGDDTDAASPETDTSTQPTMTATTPTETQTTPTETAPTETTTPAKPAPQTITIRVVGGVPQGGIARPKVKKGDRVVIVVRTDAGEEVHMHGYDIERTVTPGKPVRLPFTATIPGRFEVELHHPDSVLAVVEVRP